MSTERPGDGQPARAAAGERPGARLSAAREKRGLSQSQAAHEMRIDLATLRALEADDYGRLGAPIFVKGHLRNYAKQLDLAAEPLLAAYEAEVAPAPPALVGYRNEGAEMEGNLELKRWLPLVLGGVALVLAVLFALYLLGQPVAPPSPARAVPTIASVAATPATQPAAAGAGSLASALPAATNAAAASTTIAAGQLPHPKPAAAPATAATSPTVAEPVRAAAGAAVRLGLRFSAESWVEVYDAAGNPLLYQLFDAGQAREVTAPPPLRVFIGQAPAVAVTVDGKRLDLAPFTKRDATARFSVAAAGSVR